MPKGPSSICWNCENACCGCSWSRQFKPVPGWKAIETNIKYKDNQTTRSYIVQSCPQFKQDSTEFGLKWVNKKNEIIRRECKKRS